MAPVDWRIDDHHVVQPDVAIFCQPPDRPYFDQTPPLVVEGLSPATAYKDLEIKKRLYERCRVQFYVVVEPHDQFADLFQLAEGKLRFWIQALYGEQVQFQLGERCRTALDFGKVFDPPAHSPNLPA